MLWTRSHRQWPDKRAFSGSSERRSKSGRSIKERDDQVFNGPWSERRAEKSGPAARAGEKKAGRRRKRFSLSILFDRKGKEISLGWPNKTTVVRVIFGEGSTTHISDARCRVVVGDLNGRRLRLLVPFVFDRLTEPVPPQVTQRRRTTHTDEKREALSANRTL